MNQEINHEHRHEEGEGDRACLSRRRFLLFGVAGATLVALDSVPGLTRLAQAMVASYPSQKVGSLSALKAGEPLEFAYPYPDVHNVLVKLGAPAGGGVGPAKDIVAFNQMCTHMGGPLVGTYKGNHQVMGPCPLHLTTFDLTRHGMVVSGHATESLPQIVLEVKGDDIHATGVMGLVFGYADNTGGHA
ncbi:MAG: arsenite oxidase small subunit [Gammaproteobacteria bacterium RIFOXYA12_FULL_61_12]|nr:MAG: arsenite oxidase small subunit [Gammaproteobacteria bacterium RIFOXYA12_FULL_61_12]OGT91842.1 MAG: arsenite oxidase small subunit [Gammaproteobacteria bacterium RIFOXYD12_FULL_61_37]